MLSFTRIMPYTDGIMSSPEDFGPYGIEAHDPVEESLGKMRVIRHSWSKSILFARQCGENTPVDVRTYIESGSGHYARAFAGVAKTVADTHADIAQLHAVLDSYLVAEDEALINSINSHLEEDKLDLLSPDTRQRIILPLIDPDLLTLMRCTDANRPSEEDGLDLYKSRLDMRATLLLIGAPDAIETPKPERRTRTALGAIGIGSIGSLLSLGFLARRRRAS